MAEEKILIVDDEDTIRTFCRRALERKKYFVDTAGNGRIALEKLKEKWFNLILTDLRMPELDGLTLLRQVKKFYPLAEVVIVTAYGDIESAVEAMKEGAFDYVLKPFEIDKLYSVVEHALEKQRLAQEVKELRELKALYETAQVAIALRPAKDILYTILKNACEVLGGDAGSIMLYDEKNKTLSVEVGIGLDKQAYEEIVKVGERVSGWVIAHREPILLINGLKNDSRFKDLKSRLDIKSALSVPLLYREEVIGVVNLNTLKERFFTENELKLLIIFADVAAVTIENMRAYQALEKANLELQQLDKLKSEFVATASHELRTPLMNFRTALDILSKEKDIFLASQQSSDKRENRIFEILHKNTQRMEELVTQILDFTRIEAGLFKIVLKEFSLPELINETVESFSLLAEKKSINLKVEITQDVGKIDADRERIHQVMSNLLSNAIKFTPYGGKVEIRAVRKDGTTTPKRIIIPEIEVSVKDTGVGIPAQEKEKIFDRFYRVDTSLTRETGGFGLGLTISRHIVEAHHGKIWVDSPPPGESKGSRFCFTLPCTFG
ncbi:MAG TPA: hypothetical protein DHV62_04055 [Elusimicrobia bacterium]|jgi:signal transduction histidine kinase/DNA-binding response OmpR family regulator|nr:hypothetical protein [Elusimicrobiota bacterium]